MIRIIPPHTDENHSVQSATRGKDPGSPLLNSGGNETARMANETLVWMAPTVNGTGSMKPPSWVFKLFDGDPLTYLPSPFPTERRLTERHILVSIRIENARTMAENAFRGAVRTAYDMVFKATDNRFLIRIWNFIPGILEPLGQLPQRYMVFNGGRYEAYRDLHGANALSDCIATASGVGIEGDDMVIHALASTLPGLPVENPRQTPSCCYSKLYGPLPPCFARATAISEPPQLLVGGTASIVGETTTHLGNLKTQTAETLLNLAAIVMASRGNRQPDLKNRESVREQLDRYRHVRVYFTRPEDLSRVTDLVTGEFSGARTIELARADLCRKGLLIEIEGLANIDG